MFSIATLIANSVNPSLTVLLLGAPYYTPRRTAPWEFWLRSGLGIGLAVAIAESGKLYQVWPGHPSFPSGHQSFALAAAVSLAARDIRWLWLCVPVALLMSWALVASDFHTPVDVAGAWLISPLCALACHLWRRQSPRDNSRG